MIDYRIDESRIKIGHERIKKAYRMEYPAEIPIIDVARTLSGTLDLRPHSGRAFRCGNSVHGS